jgi:hypothetical protein
MIARTGLPPWLIETGRLVHRRLSAHIAMQQHQRFVEHSSAFQVLNQYRIFMKSSRETRRPG